MKVFRQILFEKSEINNCIFLITFFLLPFWMSAQDDSLKNDYQKEFDFFKENIHEEFESFKSHNDSVFYQFLNDSWVTFDLMKDERLVVPKPKKQPEIDIPKKVYEIVPLKKKTMFQNSNRQLQLELVPDNYRINSMVKAYTTIDFFGSRVEVYEARTSASVNESITKSSIADFFKNAVNNDELIYSVFDLRGKAQSKKLNGWGYLKLLEEASVVYYSSINEQVLFTWMALIKSGYDARVGFDENNIFLLVNFDVPVYYKLYLVKNDQKYYIIPFHGQTNKSDFLVSFQYDYPAELQALGLTINENPILSVKKKSRKLDFNDQKVTVAYNSNLAEFYSTYPDSELSVYFPPPLSAEATSSLDVFLLPALQDADDLSKVNTLLGFVQYSIPYNTDEKQFGHENYLFSEEAFHFHSIDCEDRTVLLSQLINYYTGFNCIGLVYPGHVTLAVNIPAKIQGSYVDHLNKRYYICDPTYIGAKCGMLMPEFKNENPEIIDLNL